MRITKNYLVAETGEPLIKLTPLEIMVILSVEVNYRCNFVLTLRRDRLKFLTGCLALFRCYVLRPPELDNLADDFIVLFIME